MKTELLPCPFCGSCDIDESFVRGYAKGDLTQPIVGAGCNSCGATGATVKVRDHSTGYAEAAAAWNARILDQAAPLAVDMQTLQDVYAAGWRRRHEWATADHLPSGIGSPAYLAVMAKDLTPYATQPQPAVAVPQGVSDEVREALKWYEDEVSAISRNMKASNDDAVLASITVLSLDAGNRANKALATHGHEDRLTIPDSYDVKPIPGGYFLLEKNSGRKALFYKSCGPEIVMCNFFDALLATPPEAKGVPVDGSDVFSSLSNEAKETMIAMVDHCLNNRCCLGMDEGIRDFETGEEHRFVRELRSLTATQPLIDEGSTSDKGEPVVWQFRHNDRPSGEWSGWFECSREEAENPEESGSDSVKFEYRALYTRPQSGEPMGEKAE